MNEQWVKLPTGKKFFFCVLLSWVHFVVSTIFAIFFLPTSTEPIKRRLPSYEGYDQILGRVKGIIKEKIGSSDLLDKALMKCLLEIEDLLK